MLQRAVKLYAAFDAFFQSEFDAINDYGFGSPRLKVRRSGKMVIHPEMLSCPDGQCNQSENFRGS